MRQICKHSANAPIESLAYTTFTNIHRMYKKLTVYIYISYLIIYCCFKNQHFTHLRKLF